MFGPPVQLSNGRDQSAVSSSYPGDGRWNVIRFGPLAGDSILISRPGPPRRNKKQRISNASKHAFFLKSIGKLALLVDIPHLQMRGLHDAGQHNGNRAM
jgi:hypothetical protein